MGLQKLIDVTMPNAILFRDFVIFAKEFSNACRCIYSCSSWLGVLHPGVFTVVLQLYCIQVFYSFIASSCIISPGCNTAVENLSHWVKDQLRPLANTCKYCLQDTNDIILVE